MARLVKRQVGFLPDEWEALYDEGRRQDGRANAAMVRDACRGYLRYMAAVRQGLPESQALAIVAELWRNNSH